MNRNGDDSNDWLAEAEEESPKRRRAISRKVRLNGVVKKRAEKEGGGSASARLVLEVEKRIDKPIKIKNRDWYIYEAGAWKLVDGGNCPFMPISLDVQDSANRNVRRSEDILKHLEFKHQLTREEKFYGAIRYSPDEEERYLINCLSNVLEIDCVSGKIVRTLDHNSDYMFLTKLGADYNPDASAPLFMRVAKETSPDSADRQLLLDFSATILLPNSPHECALICIGEGGNGKSVIMDSIASVIGNENVGRLTIRQICSNDRKHLCRLEKKLLNLSTETEVNEINENTTLKTIISNEDFSTDRIYKTGFEMHTSCKLCFLANNMPKFKGGSNAEARRFRVVNFPNTFEGNSRDTSLKRRLEAEKEGILRLLIERLPNIIGLTELPYGSKISKAMYRDFKVSNDPTKAFVDECLILGQKYSNYITRRDLFKTFCAYAERYNISTAELDKGATFKKIYRYAPNLQEDEDRTMIAGKQEYVIRKVIFSEMGTRLAKRSL